MKVKGKTAEVLNRLFNAPEAQESEVDVIELIHEDFDKAGDELLDFAENILKDADEDTQSEIYASLKKMGFDNVEAVKEREEKAKAKLYAKDVAEKVGYFRKHYPEHKFITKEQVRDICKKYGLVFGKTDRFIGEIPDKNKMELADFKLRESDKIDNPYMIVASQNEFNLDEHELRDGWELKELPKDPIVLAPVSGGYLVVSKWGKEADIEEIK